MADRRLDAEQERRPLRVAGYAPLSEYAVIGDGRTAALVARDGSVDWLPLPDLDCPSVFAAILDAERGGCFQLRPDCAFSATRSYVPATNVLQTTFETDVGSVRVTDALTGTGGGLTPLRELQRLIEGLSGKVPLVWRAEPRFGYAAGPVKIGRRNGVPVATSGGDALALQSFSAGDPVATADAIEGRFEALEGSSALLALTFARGEPLVFPSRDGLSARLEATCTSWTQWTRARSWDGPWRDAVMRSALVLKLLVHAPSGAIAAAPTASLPEEIGGRRNWDYRYSWIRDSAFATAALLELGCPQEADSYFWWLMHATQITHPRLHVLYRLDGGTGVEERELDLSGYLGSRPVRIGNGAAEQLQLDTYGELMQTAWLYRRAGNELDRDVAGRFADIADHVCSTWRSPDAGIWEVRSEPTQFTQSKMLCAVALDRALDLAADGTLVGKNAAQWRREGTAISNFIETQCWSEKKQSYSRFAGSDELDASLLLAVLHGFGEPGAERLLATVDAIRRELSDGVWVRRYEGEDGMAGEEGAFVACSFWLAEALARTGRTDAAADLMDDLVERANDVGLYSEEIDPGSGDFLGNMPQGLSHLALISAAAAISEADR
jgi:GH15 family glucan-1,4-alpha-glucosidase